MDRYVANRLIEFIENMDDVLYSEQQIIKSKLQKLIEEDEGRVIGEEKYSDLVELCPNVEEIVEKLVSEEQNKDYEEVDCTHFLDCGDVAQCCLFGGDPCEVAYGEIDECDYEE